MQSAVFRKDALERESTCWYTTGRLAEEAIAVQARIAVCGLNVNVCVKRGHSNLNGSYGNRSKPTVSLDERQHPINIMQGLDALKQAFGEILQGHYFLLTCEDKIRHRNISVENLMFRVDDENNIRGALNDWDLSRVGSSGKDKVGSSRKDKVGSSGKDDIVPKDTRTGTPPYMSMDLLPSVLKPPRPVHLERFEWESFFYVLYWIACHYNEGKDVNPDALKEWLLSDTEMLLHVKRSLLIRTDYKSFTPQFWPLALTWIYPLVKLLSKGYDARKEHDDMVLFGIEGRSESTFDDETLGGHVTYEKVWRILKN